MRYIDAEREAEQASIDDAASLSLMLRRQGWRYTARPQWSSKGESMWMRLSKFSLCNRLSVAELAELLSLRNDYGSSDSGDLRRIGHWDREALASHLGISAEDVQASFCSVAPQQLLVHAATELRYCEPCLVDGFHAAWFQWQHIERCPLHDKHLRSGCLQCATPIPYVLGVDLALSPLRCSSCRCAWVLSLHHPAGRCVPLARRERERFRRWSEYVNQVVTVDPHRRRDRHTGQYLADKLKAEGVDSTRPHLLTMVNRLFDTPPPLLGQLTKQFAVQRQPPSSTLATTSAGSADIPVGYDRQQWPHFAKDFARCERLVRVARDHLFARALADFDYDYWRQLLLDGLVTPTSAMRRDTAAALGWTVSWLGASQLLTSVTEVSAPALGLIGWLARIPIRPTSTPRGDWHGQVLAWLRDDLVLSAWIWSRMATFMSSKRFYLLYGEAVSPVALAIRHAGRVR